MINVTITAKMRARAEELCTGVKFNAHTYRESGAGQLTGYLGELAFAKSMGDIKYAYIGNEKKHADFVVGSTSIDVKTKERSVSLKDHYTVHVETRIKGEDCDLYAFANHNIKTDLIQLAGYLPCDEFWMACKYVKKGELDAFRFPEKMDAGTLEVRQLRDLSTLFMYASELGI